jgi:hypothetical protein
MKDFRRAVEVGDRYRVNAEQSKMEIHVYREGLLKAFGHDHLTSAKQLSGQVQLAQPTIAESSVNFAVETRSLVVLDPGESENESQGSGGNHAQGEGP